MIGSVENCGFDVFALLEMVIDILDRHRRFIDKDTDRQRQAAKRHDVHRFAERRERRDRRQNRERYRGGDDDRRPHASEKQKDHDARQRRGENALMHDVGHGIANENRLIAKQCNLQLIGQSGLDFGKLVLDPLDDRECRNRTVLQDR